MRKQKVYPRAAGRNSEWGGACKKKNERREEEEQREGANERNAILGYSRKWRKIYESIVYARELGMKMWESATYTGKAKWEEGKGWGERRAGNKKKRDERRLSLFRSIHFAHFSFWIHLFKVLSVHLVIIQEKLIF